MPYGTIVPNLKIEGKPAPYGVVNEREVRGGAGLMLAIAAFTFAYVYYTRDYSWMYVVVPVFWLDFFLKTVFQPKYSIFGNLARLFVFNQKPEYVGAVQKRLAWGMGLTLATIMLIFPIGMGVRGWLPFTICSVCILFMWLEAVFGICVGCKVYSLLLKFGIVKMPEHKPTCPGGVCELKPRK